MLQSPSRDPVRQQRRRSLGPSCSHVAVHNRASRCRGRRRCPAWRFVRFPPVWVLPWSEAVAEDSGERFGVGQKPRLHALHHEVRLLVRGSFRPVPPVALSIPQVRPWVGAFRNRTLAVDEKHEECVVAGSVQRRAEVIVRLPPTATGDHARQPALQPGGLESHLERLAAFCLQRPTSAAAFHVHPRAHQRLPPSSPFIHNSPRLYRASHWVNSSLSSRRSSVLPACFSQMTTHSGSSVNASTRTSE